MHIGTRFERIIQRAHDQLLAHSREALSVILPPLCPIAGTPVSTPGQLSPAVWRALDFVTAPYCLACGVPLTVYVDGEDDVCGLCQVTERLQGGLISARAIDLIRAPLLYNDNVSQLILKFKYADRLDMAAGLAALMALAMPEIPAWDSAILVPVPLHHTRLVSRKYNQAAILASVLARRYQLTYLPTGLHRTKQTRSQRGLNLRQRQRNVAGAFRVNPAHRENVEGRHIILVDDVLTTGATLTACARRLKRAGAIRVSVLILARVMTNPTSRKRNVTVSRVYDRAC